MEVFVGWGGTGHQQHVTEMFRIHFYCSQRTATGVNAVAHFFFFWDSIIYWSAWLPLFRASKILLGFAQSRRKKF